MGLRFHGHRSVSKHDGSTADAWLNESCGHCGRTVGFAVVAFYSEPVEGTIRWLWCPVCANGSIQNPNGTICPRTVIGPEIEGLPPIVAEAYAEARRCLLADSPTGCELLCRKILMSIAVDKGEQDGKSFAEYLTYLEAQGYVTVPMRGWVDIIRQHGNKATHKLETPDAARAESTLMFTAELLRLIYEMDFMARKYIPNPPSST